MSNIPSLDLNDFLSNDKKRKDDFVKSVGKAYQKIGFLSLKNHFVKMILFQNIIPIRVMHTEWQILYFKLHF